MISTEPRKYRKKPVVVTASQWFKNGDHPEDYAEDKIDADGTKWTADYQREHDWEGQVVRYYRHPDYPGGTICDQCGQPLHVHGWIDTLEQGHRVCPADVIITGVQGERYPCKPDIFEATYSPAEDEEAPAPSLRELQARAYQQSADKGFHDDEPTEPRAVLSLNAERIALMHSELSEALEELRKGQPVNFTYYPATPLPSSLVAEVGVGKAEELMPVNTKPEGVPSELADVVIRVLDFCGANDIDLQSIVLEKLAYNASRAHKHGKEF